MYQNRMALSKSKDKDYMQTMKKGLHLSVEIKQQLEQFDVCHHCKYIYPEYLLTTCKFVSDRQSMPKTIELEPDLHLDNSNIWSIQTCKKIEFPKDSSQNTEIALTGMPRWMMSMFAVEGFVNPA